MIEFFPYTRKIRRMNGGFLRGSVLLVCRGSNGIDHIFFDNGIRRIGVDERAYAKIINEGKHDGNTQADGEEKNDQCYRKCGNQRESDQCKNVSLDTKYGKDQRVLEKLAQLHIKGNQKQICVESEDHINDYERKGHRVHQIGKTAGRRVIEIYEIVCKYTDAQAIDQAENKPLLPILSDGVKVIGENEYAVAANQASGDVNRTDLLPTVGNYQEYHQSADYPINVGVIGWQA